MNILYRTVVWMKCYPVLELCPLYIVDGRMYYHSLQVNDTCDPNRGYGVNQDEVRQIHILLQD